MSELFWFFGQTCGRIPRFDLARGAVFTRVKDRRSPPNKVRLRRGNLRKAPRPPPSLAEAGQAVNRTRTDDREALVGSHPARNLPATRRLVRRLTRIPALPAEAFVNRG